MCECLKRADGTWHVDECCAQVMDDFHSGSIGKDIATITRAFHEIFDLAGWHTDDEADPANPSPEDQAAHVNGLIRQIALQFIVPASNPVLRDQYPTGYHHVEQPEPKQ